MEQVAGEEDCAGPGERQFHHEGAHGVAGGVVQRDARPDLELGPVEGLPVELVGDEVVGDEEGPVHTGGA